MMASLNLLPPKVWITGLPRNDWLLTDLAKLPPDLRLMEEALREQLAGRRLVLYAPTFRKNRPGTYAFSSSEIEKVAAFLRHRNAVLGVRPHINETVHPEFTKHPEIIDLSFDQWPETQIVLRIADVLLTDYSGIWVDYLLMKRPIVGFIYDWDDYTRERGFIYDLQRIFPGPLVKQVSDLKPALANALDDNLSDETRFRHRSALGLFHAFEDDQSCHRVLQELVDHLSEL